MSKVIFVYKGNEFIIQCEKNAKMSTVLNSYFNKTLLPRNSVYFLCNGEILNNEMTEDKIALSEDNKKKVLVYDYNDNNQDEIIKSNEIICNTCKESSRIEINDYKITLYGCKNKHKNTDIKFNQFNQTQNINISKIICSFCPDKNKGNSYNKQFYRCLTCKKDLCIMCKEKHPTNHNIINYDEKNYICEEHGEYYHSYCYQCEKNMCTSCENIHKNHAMESFGSLIKDRTSLLQENENFRINIEKLNKIISDIISKLNKIRENFLIYYEIHKSIICYNNKFRNFEILYNINEFTNNTIKKDIEKIIKDSNINNQVNTLMNIYHKMETEKIDAQSNQFFFDESESESEFNLFKNEQKQPKQKEQNNNINKNNILSKSTENLIKKEDEEDKKQEQFIKSKSTMIEFVNEFKNILLEEVINKTPIISELMDIKELLKNYKSDSPEINIAKLVTSKYSYFRETRSNGNSFYICFIYRLFEYISLNRNQFLLNKISQKILEAKNIIIKNGYDWDFLKDSFSLFAKEFLVCFEQANVSLKTGKEYLAKLFKSEESFNYLNLFIHFCIAAYIKENKILYEDYIHENFETFIRKVEEIGLECTQLEILACANFFDVGIKIEYLYKDKNNTVKFPEDKKSDEIFIYILFRPNSYDILYK